MCYDNVYERKWTVKKTITPNLLVSVRWRATKASAVAAVYRLKFERVTGGSKKGPFDRNIVEWASQGPFSRLATMVFMV